MSTGNEYNNEFSNALVSVIVAIYNAEEYIDKCITSIVNQSYKNLEIILVDDGCIDGCPQICDEWQNKDTRIKVVHKQNGGVGSARNAGLDMVTGEYVTFVDSDDYVDGRYVEYLYRACIENSCDMSICRSEHYENDNSKYELKCVLNNVESIINKEGQGIIRNQLYKRSLFENLRFPVGKIHEDEFIYYKLQYRSQKIAVLKNSLYVSDYNPNSITRKKLDNSRLNRIDAIIDKYRFAKENGLDWLKNIAINDAFVFSISIMSCPRRKFENFRQFKKSFKPMFVTMKHEIFTDYKLGFWRRLVVFLSGKILFPLTIYGILWKIKKRYFEK